MCTFADKDIEHRLYLRHRRVNGKPSFYVECVYEMSSWRQAVVKKDECVYMVVLADEIFKFSNGFEVTEIFL